MEYKLLTIDLDDTLLREDLTISERNIKAIRAAVEKGVKVTLASGRATQSVHHYLDVLGLEIPVISYQGARIVDTETGEVMYKKELSLQDAMPILKYAEENNIHCNMYMNDTVYINEMTERGEFYRSLSQHVPMREVGKLSEFISDPATKILFIDEHEKLKEIKSELEKIVDEEVYIFFSKPYFLEFTNKFGTKGAAVRFLADHFRIKREETMAIGDTYNDISMIEYAGLGVCMSNGPKEVRNLADHVTRSNMEDGVAHAIEKFIL
ncbi:Cof-type HAD-IIB family hydrolase [Petroclostridium sp. X23]|uniref:Cof-type HAD-IIB family hydrolase n=1 Tax=Petroclostridium sp. X23 TaxID=3045146 RepID=UPI0024AD96E1|nr:Cof-type HAD-IIB family hydrolase [Petroclostridium sp. X23]WHH57354.1 Cof-type HAD-IIB family hydrolase [Petroclostridium sp. X23]